MKKFLWLIILFFVGLIDVFALELDIMSKNAVLYNLDDFTILYEKEAEEEIPIASMTKIMTSIVVVENVDNLDEQITLTSDDFRGLVEANASVAGFYVGQKVTYKDLLYGLLLPSGADAAQALTRALGGREKFVSLMNAKALELGLNHTHFENETGLDSDNHYSTVKEVAIMFKYALNIPELKNIFLQSTYTTSDNNLTFNSTILNYKNYYNIKMDYLLGGKTGTTDNAGLCLASFANYNNINYLLVTARAYDDNYRARQMADAKIVYEYFMNNYGNQQLILKDDEILTLNTLYAKEKKISFYAPTSLYKYLENNWDKNNLKIEYIGNDNVKYNTKIGTKLGVVNVYYMNELLATYDINLNEKLHFDLKEFLVVNQRIIIYSILGLIGLIIIILIIRKLIKRKNNTVAKPVN